MKLMKHFYLSIILFVILIVVGISVQKTENPIDASAETAIVLSIEKCKYGQCYATAKSTGNRCLHCVSKSGDSYCWQHK